tara:strand:+ start:115 stop:714 length:600 start_codon:yes stop_codon:yes gene_type:complete
MGSGASQELRPYLVSPDGSQVLSPLAGRTIEQQQVELEKFTKNTVAIAQKFSGMTTEELVSVQDIGFIYTTIENRALVATGHTDAQKKAYYARLNKIANKYKLLEPKSEDLLKPLKYEFAFAMREMFFKGFQITQRGGGDSWTADMQTEYYVKKLMVGPLAQEWQLRIVDGSVADDDSTAKRNLADDLDQASNKLRLRW